MEELEPGTRKFLIVNRLLLISLFMAAIVWGVNARGRAQTDALIALSTPFGVTLDFTPDFGTDLELDETVADEELSVPVAGEIAEDAGDSETEQNDEATETDAAANEEPVAQPVYSANTYQAKATNQTTTSATTTTSTANTASQTTTKTANYDGYYVDDNGVYIDNTNTYDNTPRYNLYEPTDDTPYVDDNGVDTDAGEGETE